MIDDDDDAKSVLESWFREVESSCELLLNKCTICPKVKLSPQLLYPTVTYSL